MTVLDTVEKKILSVVKVSAFAAIAPVLVAIGGFYGYHQVMSAVAAQNEKQSLVLIAMEKQGLSGRLLKVVDEKLGPKIPSETKVDVCNTLIMMCSAKGIPLYLACGLIEVESNWNYLCISSSGAKGLTQVMPAMAKPYLRLERRSDNSNELFNPITSIIVGLSILADFQNQYVESGVTEATNFTFALHSYYWGGNNSATLLGKKDTRVNVPNFSYPIRVMTVAKQYKERGL